VKILISEEYPERERLSLSFLRRTLEARGHEVQLTNPFDVPGAIRRYQPDVMADNALDSVAHYAGKLAALTQRQRYVNLNWEQLANPFNLFRYRYETAVAERFVDGRVSWGPTFKEILAIENPGMDRDRISVTGSMQHTIDTLFTQLPRGRLRAVLPYELGRYERVVLATESFEIGSRPYPTYRHGRFGPKLMPYMYEICRRADLLRAGFVALINRLAAQRPKFLFIVRVHPGKNLGYYETYSKRFQHPNVAINHFGDIGTLLHASDLVIASRSGVLVDAHLVGRPALNLFPEERALEDSGIFDTMEQKFGRACVPDEIDGAALDSFFDTLPPRTPEQQTLLDKWLGPLGLGAFERAADLIEEVTRRPPLPKGLPLGLLANPRTLDRYVRNVGKRFRRPMRRPKPDFDYARVFEELLAASRPEARRPTEVPSEPARG
jgi:hypothetical protein